MKEKTWSCYLNWTIEKENSMTDTFKKAMFEAFDKLQKNTIRVLYDKAENSVPTGGSKIGGRPDLPADFVWPLSLIHI